MVLNGDMWMKLKVNRKHFVEVSNIEKIAIKKNIVWIYRFKGYPKVYKTDYDAYTLRLRLVNLGLCIKDFKVERGNTK